ncbi:hypothetical protein CCR90_13425 [Rhodovulum sulfidophilum]|nr:hypothetical protein [Rhodovulum sulfidophilum]
MDQRHTAVIDGAYGRICVYRTFDYLDALAARRCQLSAQRVILRPKRRFRNLFTLRHQTLPQTPGLPFPQRTIDYCVEWL